ncbi:hypothetical protein KOR34_31920 [Posidoniimonas corsicana]|uniref:Uncharacterized protein n=1 Tax=Posidoniimonas corsicana TaxID=1938618 RepID=A0A5C5VJQ8_9BACT|nr:hypothetical protein KOR34_31920 [Posidoniimonas corsicana]
MQLGYAFIAAPTAIFSAEALTSNRGRRKACGWNRAA